MLQKATTKPSYPFQVIDFSIVDDRIEAEVQEGTCQYCGELLEPIYDNVGFTAPDPEKWEIVEYKPCTCGADDMEVN